MPISEEGSVKMAYPYVHAKGGTVTRELHLTIQTELRDLLRVDQLTDVELWEVRKQLVRLLIDIDRERGLPTKE